MVQANRIMLVAIAGCTAVGKSEVALNLAREFNGEIIGADSMQIYKGFDIGTGKLSINDCGGIAHKMIDVADGDSDYSVGEYVDAAKQSIVDTHDNGKLPILVGGTGLYIYSLLSGCNFADTPKNDALRTEFKLLAHIVGANVLHSLLSAVDELSAQKISPNDVKRTVRALEIYALTGKRKSNIAQHTQSPFNARVIVLELPRDVLYARINARVKQMFDNGLIEEVNKLMRYKNNISMQAIGYKQIAAEPNAPRAYLEELVAQKTRNYAKRQCTYFRNMKLDKVFIDARNYDKIRNIVKGFIEQNG